MSCPQPYDLRAASCPADLVLSKEECSHYHTYQRQCREPQELRVINYAKDYRAFQDYYSNKVNSRRALSRFAGFVEMGIFANKKAAKCKHPLHPVATKVDDYCPVCQVRMCLDFLDLIQQAWSWLGGPYQPVCWIPKNAKEQRDRTSYDRLGSAWRKAKLELLGTVDQLRDKMVTEQAVEDKSLDAYIYEPFSAKRALELSEQGWTDPTPYMTDQEILEWYNGNLFIMTNFRVASRLSGKKVHFTDDTNFDSGRGRCSIFRRGHSDYKPGKYACPDKKNYLNTSMYGVNDFNSQQLKTIAGSTYELNHGRPKTQGKYVVGPLVGCHKQEYKICEAAKASQKRIPDIWKACFTEADALYIAFNEDGKIEIVFPIETHKGVFNWIPDGRRPSRWTNRMD
ncbi:hypothetical protein BU24DRAFT_406183 [Aaosphaeria arxii CBS 175.79]|uniref:Uncharacterized protein n=1 Tax=Aaosphaeria arxii CBS 175.79 TaxID=1450172 RepID=A0A6A5Y1Z4_9PLEO|nr:uncharacterized protein BU24DRAFT_406183 [Aaosphaeria arxii CBS 175.79]KAF2019518.1 hypothetical protein BU24DRAFT_406183 [Aaosphaeria arxii CBS 175.79]